MSSNNNNNNNNRTIIPAVITTGRGGFRPATAGNRSGETSSGEQLLSKLTAKCRELEERTAELEREKTRRNNQWTRSKLERNPQQSRWIRQYYRDYCNAHGSDGWVVTETLDKSTTNQVIRDNIARRMETKAIEISNGDSEAFKAEIQDRIRNHYENIREQHKQRTERTAEELALRQRRNNMNQRLTKKCNKRKGNFVAYKDQIVSSFGPERECMAFLDKGYMSEEEVYTVDSHGQATTFKKLVPKWRSEKLNAFYRELDTIKVRRRPDNSLPRESETVDASPTHQELLSLPAWGVNSEIYYN